MELNIELREVGSSDEFKSIVLKKRAAISSKPPITRHYVALCNKQEVAFVAIDVPPNKGYLCIYELLVEPKMRCRGLGSAVVRKCQEMARQLGCKKICLIPRPIEAGTTEEQLVRWYTRLGFVQSKEQDSLLEIVF